MKKIIFLFAAFFVSCAAWASAGAGVGTEILTVGNLEVERVKNYAGKDFFFSNIIYPQQKRTLAVSTRVGGDDTFNLKDPTVYPAAYPAYKEIGDVMFFYVQNAWKEWRDAANPYLPAKYKLPQLQLQHIDAFENAQKYKNYFGQNSAASVNILFMALPATVGIGGGSNPVRGIGMAQYLSKGGGMATLKFAMEENWLAWMNARASKTPAEQKAAADLYKKSAAGWLTGEFYAPEAEDSFFPNKYSDDFKATVKTLSKSAPETWQKEGPWAAYNQHIITHELGHILGLAHVEGEDNSIMASYVEGGEGSALAPSKADGRRLATMACYYHNQKAKKDVCIPLQEAAEEVKKAAASTVKNLGTKEGTAWTAAGDKAVPTARLLEPAPEKQLPALGAPVSPAKQTSRDKTPVNLAKKPVKDSGALPKPVSGLSSGAANANAPKMLPALARELDEPLSSSPANRANGSQPAMLSSLPPALQGSIKPAQAVAVIPSAEPAEQPLASLPKQARKAANPSDMPQLPAAHAPSAASDELDKPAAKVTPPAPVQPAAPKIVCDVCKKELADGSYYTDSTGRHIHKHSECAYRYFARFHKTDTDSLARYDDFYAFGAPKDVRLAKDDLRSLDLTTNEVRRYAGERASKARQLKQDFAQDNQAREAKAKSEESCNMYVTVTQKDIAAYAQDNQEELRSIRKKLAGGRPLSRKETRIKRIYDQMNENYKITQYCTGLQAKAQ